MMTDKCAFQKMYEKMRMISLHSSELSVMCADRRDSRLVCSDPGLYVCLGNVPLAKLLPKAELDETVPQFEKSKQVQACFERMQGIDSRTAESDFNVIVGDGFEEEFLRSVDDIC